MPKTSNEEKSTVSLIKLLEEALKKGGVLTTTDKKALEGVLDRKRLGVEKYHAIRETGSKPTDLNKPAPEVEPTETEG
jgi:hypothetical protein